MRTSKRGLELLLNPLLNKGTAFTNAERDALGLHGLLPSHVSSVEEQLERSYINFTKKRTPIGQYAYLMSLLNRNELLFYQLVLRHVAEMLPVIYTPTVGEAAIQYSQIYSNRRGFYVSAPLEDKIEAMVDALPQDEIDVLVVTDGERILGLGDQGVGGMTIPVGKLSLYTLFGGIHPAKTLPVILDVGTNNEQLLKDPLYLGWRNERLRGERYDRIVERFVRAIRKRYPKALLQWEDFGKPNARRLLDQYRSQILSFNDDIQGTAAVVVAALLAAVKAAKGNIADQKVVILGAGSAGTGIADMLSGAHIPREQIYLIDMNGLIHYNTPNVDASQKPFAKTRDEIAKWRVNNVEHISLGEVVANVHPSVLVGVSAQTGAFTKEIVESMQAKCARPIIFPLSNPTSKSEATPQELLSWTNGQALVATGSPFQPVTLNGASFEIAQCNNVYIFPGVGLGTLAAGARAVSDGMFLAAAAELAECSPALREKGASLFPKLTDVRAASQRIALAVAKQAIQEGLAEKAGESELRAKIAARVWEPTYPVYA